MEDGTIFTLIMASIIIFGITLFASSLYYDSICTYENINATVLDKYIDEYTTTAVFSNGKMAWTAPVQHADYHLNTTYGDIQVSSSVYEAYNVNDTVNLTKNINTSHITMEEI